MPYPVNSKTIPEAAAELRGVLQTAPALLKKIAEHDASLPLRPGAWSRKEILGHLIDSAANNHHRFIRAQSEQPFSMPGYDQDRWVAAGAYRDQAWDDLIGLWTLYNTHLVHVMAAIPSEASRNLCSIGGSPAVTLEFIAVDYVGHLLHHLRQIATF